MQDLRLQKLIDVIVPALTPDAIYLFGSQATGQARADSDYDLFVVVPDKTPPEKMTLNNSYLLADTAGVPADIFVCRQTRFGADKNALGTLTCSVLAEGRKIYTHA